MQGMENAGDALLKAVGSSVSCADSVKEVISALQRLRSSAFSNVSSPIQETISTNSGPLYGTDLFPAIAKLLLYKVVPDWLDSFTSEERDLLFDAFFLHARPSEALSALVPALALKPSEGDEKTSSVLFQAERLLVTLLIQKEGVKSLAEEFGGNKQEQVNREVAQILSSVPDKVRSKAPRSLTSPQFVTSAVSQLLDAAKVRWGPALDFSTDGTFIFIGEVFCKLCRRGHADVVAERAVSSLISSQCTAKQADVGDEMMESTYWQAVVHSMKDMHALERFSEAALYALSKYSVSDSDAYYVLYSLFGDPSFFTVRTLFTDRFLLWKVFPLRVLRWILDYAVFLRPDVKKIAQTDIVTALAEAWGERNFIQSASAEQHTYVTAALGICLKETAKEDVQKALLKCVLDGVSRRLESPLQSVHRMAKQIAYTVSVVFNPENPLLLDDADSVKDIENWDLSGVLGGPKPEFTVHEPEESGSDAHSRMLLDEEDDDCRSEASLKPYDISDDESDPVRTVYPYQLSTCIGSLRKGDDPDAVSKALDVCEKLVRLRPVELENSAADLAHALVHVRYTAVEGEEDAAEAKRRRSLVALLVCAPLPAAEVLTRELYSAHVDITQRLMILEVLSDAAQELARGDQEQSLTEAKTGPWKEVYHDFPRNSLVSWAQTFERELPPKPGQRELGKSRRWGNRSLQLQKERWTAGQVKRNMFAPVAASFMLPVMRDYDKRCQGLDLLGSDYVVLGKLIYMLGVCMECLSYQPDAALLGASLLDMLRSRAICKHPEVYVRRAALFAVSRVLVALHPSHWSAMDESLSDGLDWVRRWCMEVAANDVDPSSSKMALACIHVHSELAFEGSRLVKDPGPASGSLVLPFQTTSRPAGRSLITPL